VGCTHGTVSLQHSICLDPEPRKLNENCVRLPRLDRRFRRRSMRCGHRLTAFDRGEKLERLLGTAIGNDQHAAALSSRLIGRAKAS
jgi:hypothetical protein